MADLEPDLVPMDVRMPGLDGLAATGDVSSPRALTHNGSSDPAGIVSMVRWEQQHRGADPNRVYATGFSSGAMETNVLLGDYPGGDGIPETTHPHPSPS